jgi:SAM-dependent methyltransferase
MTGARDPEVSVDELMQKIKNEVAKRQKSSMLSQPTSIGRIMISPTNLSNIEALLNAATLKSQVRTDLPAKFNRFPWNLSGKLKQIALKAYAFLLKEQRAVNFSLIQALRESLLLNRQLSGLVTASQAQLDKTQAQLDKTQDRLDETRDHLSVTEARLNQIDVFHARLSAAEIRLSATEQHLSAITMLQERLSALKSELDNTQKQLSSAEVRHTKTDSYLKIELAQQKRLISLFIEETRQRASEPLTHQQLQDLDREEQHLLDAFYVEFEDRFRGSSQSLHSRFKVYLPLIEQAEAGTLTAPVLDIGCGRGEWLTLLREHCYVAKGIDINRVMLEQCQESGLEVQEADAVEYLRSLPDSSLGVVSAFHVIEHLPFTTLVCLLDESLRVLKPGGLILFETPNIRNILVGSGDFYRDPTHQTPLHPDTLSFIAGARGFVRSESYFFEEKDESSHLILSSSIRFDDLNDYVNISRDVVLVAYKV